MCTAARKPSTTDGDDYTFMGPSKRFVMFYDEQGIMGNGD